MSCNTSHDLPTGLRLQFSFGAKYTAGEDAILDRLKARFVVAFAIEPSRRESTGRHEPPCDDVTLSHGTELGDAIDEEGYGVRLPAGRQPFKGFCDGYTRS